MLIELVQVWQITPLAALLILAALQSIPQELYEAARVDGAGRWEMFRASRCRWSAPAWPWPWSSR